MPVDKKWYVGVMNDALFVVTMPPSPSGSDVPVDTPHPCQEVICKVESGDHNTDIDRANMIAASPELYAALERCAEELQLMRAKYEPCCHISEDYSPAGNTAEGKASAVLAKARGEKCR